VNVKLLLIAGLVGLTIGIGLTLLYFSLAKFFAVNASVLDRNQKAAEEIATGAPKAQPSEMRLRLHDSEALQKDGTKTAATGGN
jgi:hypothetical protein